MMELNSPDPEVRAKALRTLCPCHGSFQLLEENLELVRRMQKDLSPLVRAVAFHIVQDAGVLESMEASRERAELAREKSLRKGRIANRHRRL